MISLHPRITSFAAVLLGIMAISFCNAQEGAGENTIPSPSTAKVKKVTKVKKAEIDPDRVAAAEAMFLAMEMEKLQKESLKRVLEAQVEQFVEMGVPEEGVVELYDEMLDFVMKTMGWEKTKPEFTRIYANAFTADEMKELTVFYSTPVGKKSLSLTPKLMAEGLAVTQKKAQEHQTELQRRIDSIIEKHMVPK